MRDILQGLLVGKNQVEILGWLEMLRKFGIQPREEKRVVMGQPLHPQVPYEVSHVLIVVVYTLSTKEGSCLDSDSR